MSPGKLLALLVLLSGVLLGSQGATHMHSFDAGGTRMHVNLLILEEAPVSQVVTTQQG